MKMEKLIFCGGRENPEKNLRRKLYSCIRHSVRETNWTRAFTYCRVHKRRALSPLRHPSYYTLVPQTNWSRTKTITFTLPHFSYHQTKYFYHRSNHRRTTSLTVNLSSNQRMLILQSSLHHGARIAGIIKMYTSRVNISMQILMIDETIKQPITDNDLLVHNITLF